MANVTARPYEAETEDAFASEVRKRLVEQLTSPVLWSQSCSWLSEHISGEYHELAPGKVLSGLMRRISRQTKVTNHDQPG